MFTSALRLLPSSRLRNNIKVLFFSFWLARRKTGRMRLQSGKELRQPVIEQQRPLFI